jgi:hypothetical protein
MLTVVAQVVPRVGYAASQAGSLASWADHRLTLAACLLIVFLVLTWIRVLLSGGAKSIGRDFEV